MTGHSYFGLGLVVCLLIMVASLSFWGIRHLKPERFTVNGEAVALETRAASSGEEYGQIKRLLARVFGLKAPVTEIRPGLTDPVEMRDPEEVMIEQQMTLLMKEFGAERLTVPPDFIKEVHRYVGQYQERDRSLMAGALVHKREILEKMRGILRSENLPEDLAYMALVESGFLRSSASQDGAVGFWQFTEDTAREYGMEVSENVDDRLDLSKSTEAASRYIRDLILEFGTGSSVMLAIAAYNSGPEKVKRAVRKVKDPINQRNFWYLYQTRALPAETREYVPKVFAAILIGRNPEQFGFHSE